MRCFCKQAKIECATSLAFLSVARVHAVIWIDCRFWTISTSGTPRCGLKPEVVQNRQYISTCIAFNFMLIVLGLLCVDDYCRHYGIVLTHSEQYMPTVEIQVFVYVFAASFVSASDCFIL